MIELRPYQRECVDRVLSTYEEGESKYEIIVLPTGAGKTVCFSHIIHELQKKHGIRALIIAHRDELLNQAADKFRLIKPDAIIGKIGSGVHEYGGEVTVASIQTICRESHVKKMQEIGYGIIIIDEAHHIASASYTKVLNALFANASLVPYVLGVTATPERLDRKDIFKGKKPLYQIDIISMVRQGYLCNFKAIAIKTEVNIDSVKKSLGDFNEKELDHAVNIPERNQLIVSKYKEYADGKRAACFCVSVDHAEQMSLAFEDAGVPSAVIKGGTPIEERTQIYQDFHDGKVKALCSVMVLTEGWDEPLVECIIMARPTQSKGLYIQCVGRGLRLAPNKVECLLLDITDNCTRHKLTPYNLKRAIEKENMRNGESILDTLAREKSEKEAEVKEIILREKRQKDKEIDPFRQFEWEKNEYGVHYMVVGRDKHKIALLPLKNDPDRFHVAAKLAHDHGQMQKWTFDALSFDHAKLEAEKNAQKILDDPNQSTYLVDRNATWRKKPASEGQIKMLRWYNIPNPQGLTSGEASDLIELHKASIARRKVARQNAKQEVVKA